MKISVVICTWNRAAFLDQTLSTLCQLQIPKDLDWELLVVNNNSTDATDSVIERYTGSLPLRRLFEAIPGKSVAANQAIAEAGGSLIVWTDDDVLVDRDWLVHYAEAAEAFPEASYFGGTIEPWFEEEPPHWIVQEMKRFGSVYAALDLGPSNRSLLPGEWVFGANMMFRRSVATQFPFNPQISPLEKKNVRGEDVEVQQRMIASGYSGAWVGLAKVRHHIPKARLTKHYIRDWYRGNGQSVARLEGSQSVPRLWGYPRHAVRRYLASKFKQTLWSLERRRWAEAFTTSAYLEGYLAETKRLHGNGRSQAVSS